MAKVAQLVRVSVCGTECREFESHLSPQCRKPPFWGGFLYWDEKERPNSQEPRTIIVLGEQLLPQGNGTS